MRDTRNTPPSRQIGVGDLVQIVRSCRCGYDKGNGLIYRVESIAIDTEFRCERCFQPYAGPRAFAGGPSDFATPIYRLKRIPPLSELGDVETKEEIHE